MNNTENCERCDGSGVDPMQALFDDEVALCVECRGDGVLLIVVEHEPAAEREELLLSA